jgi:predicted RNA-binding Zn-ribbon protein involved in translation (DUF1610 family)
MNENKKKIQRQSHKPCPECGEMLCISNHEHNKDGVKYSDTCMICLNCGYTTAYKKRNERKKIEFEPD